PRRRPARERRSASAPGGPRGSGGGQGRGGARAGAGPSWTPAGAPRRGGKAREANAGSSSLLSSRPFEEKFRWSLLRTGRRADRARGGERQWDRDREPRAAVGQGEIELVVRAVEQLQPLARVLQADAV